MAIVAVNVHSERAPDDPGDRLLYVARASAVGADAPIAHAIYGRVFEPALTALEPAGVAPELGAGLVRVRALDQLSLIHI